MALEEKEGSYGRWNRYDRCRWCIALFLGSCCLYSARSTFPIAIKQMSDEMSWDKTESGVILAIFFWGYMVLQVPGGLVSDRLGGDKVIVYAVFLWSTLLFLTHPVLYYLDGSPSAFYVIMMSRLLFGALQSVHFPAITSLIATHTCPQDRNSINNIAHCGSHFGNLLQGLFGSLMLTYCGWPYVFYLVSVGCFLWAFLTNEFLVKPKSEKSREVVTHSQALAHCPPTAPSPFSCWLLFSKPPFWALFVAHFCESYSFYTLFSWIPTFFQDTFPEERGWLYNVSPWITSVPTSIITGRIVDAYIGAGWSVTTVRKVVCSISFLGGSFTLLLLAYGPSSFEFCLCLVTLFMFFNVINHSCTAGANAQDLSPTHSGIIFGVVNTGGCIPGFFGVYTTGYILEHYHSWQIVWSSTAAVLVVGWAVFLLFGTGKRIL